MSTLTLPPIPSDLPAEIVGKFNICMTSHKFQQLADEGASLEYTEDNLPQIKEHLEKIRVIERGVEAVHKSTKQEALEYGRKCDSAKNAYLSQLSAIKLTPQAKYEALCRDVLKRQQAQEAERQRISTIKSGIEGNAISFAKQIADATTSEQLTGIERMVNLEKGKAAKYQEFLPDAVTRFNELNSLLATQKVTVRGLEENKRQQELASQSGDDETLLALKEEEELQTAKIEEAKVVVQEAAINQSVNSTAPIEVETILPKIKPSRTTWEYEVVSEKEVMKKAPELVIFSLDDKKVKDILKTLKDSNQLDGRDELSFNGLRFFKKITF